MTGRANDIILMQNTKIVTWATKKRRMGKAIFVIERGCVGNNIPIAIIEE